MWIYNLYPLAVLKNFNKFERNLSISSSNKTKFCFSETNRVEQNLFLIQYIYKFFFIIQFISN